MFVRSVTMLKFCWLTVVFFVSITMAKSKLNFGEKVNNVRKVAPLVWIRELLLPEDGFLAGENTPVWIAHRDDMHKSVSYMKLETGIVKEAIDDWKSGEFKHSTPEELPAEELSSLITKVYPKSTSNDTMDKSSLDSHLKVVYPSILIMMDYNTIWPVDSLTQKQLIKKKIRYVLAFWNSVDLQLRHIQNPKIRLRIAGIVIGKNKSATPYIQDSTQSTGFRFKEALDQMSQYWHNLSAINKDFSKDAYHLVATMTDTSIESIDNDLATHGINFYGPPCYANPKISFGIIFFDDLHFHGIQTAVHEISHTMGMDDHDGDTTDCPQIGDTIMLYMGAFYNHRIWSECSLNTISSALQSRGKCMKHPAEYHPPGKPIKMILPGELLSGSEQCKIGGWEDGYVCPTSNCNLLFCANNAWYSECAPGKMAVDGTKLWNGTCLEGNYVSDIKIASAVAAIS